MRYPRGLGYLWAFLIGVTGCGPGLRADPAAGLSAFAEASARQGQRTGAGIIGEGVALFWPAELTADTLPPSLCLVAAPRVRAALPAGWRLRPQFSRVGARTRMTLAVPPDTSLYGTGEVTGPLRRNGLSITLWNTDNYNYRDDGGRRLYQSHPWVLGVRPDGRAFGVIADTPWRADLNLANGIEFTSDAPAFPVIVIDRASPAEVLRGLAELTGTLPLPPRWALGYQQCRWSYHPDARVRQIADEFRRRRIPCDVLWMDIDYMDGYRIFTFNPREFPDPSGLSAYLHARGFKGVWMIDPGVKAEAGYRVYDTGTAADVWVRDAGGSAFQGKVWPGACVFPDFTRPETRAWWAGLYRGYLAHGADGIWNDMNEPSVFDVPTKTMPIDAWHRGGGGLKAGPHAQYHNVYGMLMTEASRAGIAAANPDRRPFVLTRSNFLGGQRYAATWTGDNASTWEHLRQSVPMTLNLGLSGQPFNGPDLGGFAGAPTPELWGQWMAMGAFFPFCRGHAEMGSPDKEPWAFGPVVEAAARTALERRYRLLPYYYTLFHESSLDGMPVMRPVFFADLRDPRLRSEDRAFLIGADLLVVPQWAGHPNRPRGIWRPISLVGTDGANAPFQAELDLRGGAILPLGRVVQNTTEESLDPLTLRVCLDAQGRATGQLYEDAGDGYGYRSGDFRLTTYRAARDGPRVRVWIERTEGNRPRPARTASVEVITDAGLCRAQGDEAAGIVVPIAD